MTKMLLVSAVALVLTSCQPGEPPADEQTDSGRSGIVTHNVCAYDPDENESVLVKNFGIDKAEDWLLIDSMSAAPDDIDLDSITENKLIAAYALITFVAPSLTDAVSAFNAMYVCTDAIYAENQCNWVIDYDPNGVNRLRVETTVGAGNQYTATVAHDIGAGYETTNTIEGVIGDLGNLTISTYEDGLLTVTRTSTRTAGGTESVQYTSAEDSWYFTETANCSGSLDLDFTDAEDGDITTLDASWTLNGAVMSGSLDYFKTGLDSVYHLAW